MSDSVLSQVVQTKYVEKAQSLDFNEFIKVVETRRSVRVFQAEAIPDSVVDRCLDMALLAPNSSNLQPWEFYWVKNEVTKKSLAELCMGQSAAKTASVLIVAVARTATWQEHCKMNIEAAARLGEVPKKITGISV